MCGSEPTSAPRLTARCAVGPAASDAPSPSALRGLPQSGDGDELAAGDAVFEAMLADESVKWWWLGRSIGSSGYHAAVVLRCTNTPSGNRTMPTGLSLQYSITRAVSSKFWRPLQHEYSES